MKKPEDSEAERCIEIRKRGKRGEHVGPEDAEFCRLMVKQYPGWYHKTEVRVFNETVPFGSNARRKEM